LIKNFLRHSQLRERPIKPLKIFLYNCTVEKAVSCDVRRQVRDAYRDGGELDALSGVHGEEGATDAISGVIFKGAEETRPAPDVIDSVMDSWAIIVCFSNPIVSIRAILAVRRYERP
jgi:hypothetical protein